jgi:RNA polymerase sigma-70 factor (ECF subfamily)
MPGEMANRQHTERDSYDATSPDEELIARVRWREEPALSAIYDRYSRLIFTIALRITGDRQSAEEVMQDVFQAVWQSAGSFQPNASFPAWLIGIARHRAIDVTRSRRYRSRAREEIFDEQIAQHVGATEAPTDAILLRQAIRGAMDKLPAPQRQALTLAYYNGLTCQEIALRLGEPVGTVKSRMRLGLSRMREILRAVEE